MAYCLVLDGPTDRARGVGGERLPAIIDAVLIGMLILIVGTVPRNVLFAANLRYSSGVPWAIPMIGLYLWFFWRYLAGWGPPETTAVVRRASLRANPLPIRVWAWALLAGTLGIATLVIALRLANRMIKLPDQQPPDLTGIPAMTLFLLLLMSSIFAGVVEEASFRGFMQGPIERRHGPVLAILITGVMFAVAHLDFTPVLLPYYVAVAAIYGMATYLTDSILPAVVLHTSGNIYSNTDLWWRGRAEWQASRGTSGLIWESGADMAFWMSAVAIIVLAVAMVWSYFMLARSVKNTACPSRGLSGSR
jgi:membrane protease YdiL (CAAX protease family)